MDLIITDLQEAHTWSLPRGAYLLILVGAAGIFAAVITVSWMLSEPAWYPSLEERRYSAWVNRS
jgi:hypothetical protein